MEARWTFDKATSRRYLERAWTIIARKSHKRSLLQLTSFREQFLLVGF